MNKYCYLASVFDGERMHVIRIDAYTGISTGDLVRLNDGKLGEVVRVVHVQADGDEYNFVADMDPIEEDWISLYRFGGGREEINGTA
jgi:hypothetical protein